jgi:hypothetical protein
MSDALHALHLRGKNVDYDCLSRYGAYVSHWDAQRNEIFLEMYHMIIDEEYLILYMSIIFKVITPYFE